VKKGGAKVTEILKFFADEFERVAGVKLNAEQRREVEVATRLTYAGERPYIAAYPKQTRAVQIAKLNALDNRQISQNTGLSIRRVQQLRKR